MILQQRRLAGTVRPEQSQRRALRDVERHVPQRPELLGRRRNRTTRSLIEVGRSL